MKNKSRETDMTKKLILLGAFIALTSGCSVAGMAGDAAITTGQVALGAADLLI